MRSRLQVPRSPVLAFFLASALVAGAGSSHPAAAQTSGPCTFNEPRPRFPHIPVWAFPGALRDSSLLFPRRCVGSFAGLPPDSIEPRARTITVRFLRDRIAEARSDFGGYRIYRVTNRPDTTTMMLIRRFSKQVGDELTWQFSTVDPNDLNFRCLGRVVHDSVVTFVDPDSNGNYRKVCRRRVPANDPNGACASPGDSILLLVPPPGPHDGFRTWYAVTYERRNSGLDANYADLFVPDTAGVIGPCGNPSDPNTCPNLNNKCYNMTSAEIEPTAGPAPNLQRVGVVPNPFRGSEAWDRVGGKELHFVNLPPSALIRIYNAAGDLVTTIEHHSTVQDFERWDLKNQNGRDVASGIYMFRIESNVFTFQDRFVVIR